jgi:transposase
MEITDIKVVLDSLIKIESPWVLKKVELLDKSKVIDIYIGFDRKSCFECSVCGELSSVYDSSIKRVRYLDWFDYRCYLNINTPRTSCLKDGIKVFNKLPWVRSGSHYSYKLESQIMSRVGEMSMSAISREIGEPDSNLWRVFNYHVKQAIDHNLDLSQVRQIAVDETANKRGHNYVTIFTDLETSEIILVEEGRKQDVFSKLYGWLFDKQGHPKNIELFSMDMSKSYKAGRKAYFSHAQEVFDRFHIKKGLNEAVDKVRKEEVKEVEELKGTKYTWLKSEKNLTINEKKKLSMFLNESSLKTATAYQQKTSFDQLWKIHPSCIESTLIAWMQNALNTNIRQLSTFVKTLNNNFDGIVNSMKTGITNAVAEGINSLVQLAKSRARGFRNIENFKSMIYFLGNKFIFNIH